MLYVNTELLEKHSIILHSLTENLQINSPMAKFTLQMLGSIAEHERNQIKQNVRLGMQRRNQLGKWNSGNQVLGYRWVSHPANRHLSHVELLDDEAELVRTMFNWYASGLGLKAIVNRLNKNGHRTKRGKLFHSISVRGILTNVNYIGKIAYTDSSDPKSKTIVDGEHEPIISKELWSKVQNLLASRSRRSLNRNDHTYLLSGLLKCPACGSSMVPSHVFRRRKSTQSFVSHYYVCGRYHSAGYAACRPHHIRADQVEGQVTQQVQHFLSKPAIAEQLVVKLNEQRNKKLQPLQQQLEDNKEKLAELKKRTLRCYELFEDSHIDIKELKTKLGKLQFEKDALEQERQELEQEISSDSDRPIPLEHIQRVLDNFKPLLQHAAPMQQRNLFQSMLTKVTLPTNRDISQIVIQSSRALLHLHIPTKKCKGRIIRNES